MESQLKLQIGKNNVQIELKPYKLELRNPFGTAHSLTTERTNGLVSVQIDNVIGYGECGLPPKKPYCYLADYNDIDIYFKSFIQTCKDRIDRSLDNKYDPFNSLPNQYFTNLRPSNNSTSEYSTFYYLFECLDECTLNSMDYSHPARSSIEMALLDAWGKFLKLPIYKMIKNDCDNVEKKPFYYTVSLCPTMEEILKSSDFGTKHTLYLKIKFDQDIDKCMNILWSVLNQLNPQRICKLSIDANSSWTPEIALKYLTRLVPLSHVISMVEQPFPIELLKGDNPHRNEQLQQWRDVKKQYESEGLSIFADESVSSQKDIPDLLPLVHGVNVKLEKSGGLRSALSTILKAQESKLGIWIGCMVASSLNVSCACHLLSLFSDLGGDLDGGLLINDETQLFTNDAFLVVDHGLVDLQNNNNGIGVLLK
ncbi:mandelate racemase/muconate lactonizing enzyme domain-containing protein [Tieghemostelium lacteum]|uniref:Mandelate racemase/muconate lactonizing enzyme domain-containing protein n=1 Tax=Tieghemostelium lacteum TaxID=361077 RepID=A0A151ZSJ6_TIELA|nr:mandelate racemase/muconate lactonizing enzyme domain-containing protein [Tieghemostelium lacteum]|eukprot:KYQ96886.1 mandelate racemase/muconate lactonizing enzyme domain-containing protein [Tieghemostelium lacteum]